MNDNEATPQIGEERVILFVKGPHYNDDPSCRFAADCFSHRFMIMLGKKDAPNFSVRAINMKHKGVILDEYDISSTVNLPYLLHDVFSGYKDVTSGIGEVRRVAVYDKIYEEDDPPKIEVYVEGKFPPYLRTKNPRAYKVQEDLFHKFILYLNVQKGEASEVNRLNALLEELKKIDAFLEQNGTVFLSGDSVTLPDCQLLPKLYQIQIGGRYYKQFEFPDNLQYLKRYVEAGKLDQAFHKNAPNDKEIIKALERHLPKKNK